MNPSLQKLFDDAVAFLKTDQGLITLGAVGLVYFFAFCRICSRVGFHPAVGLLMLVPPFTLLLPLVLAFWPSPRERELRTLRKIQKTVHRGADRSQRYAA